MGRGQKFHSSARNYQWNLEKTSTSSQSTHRTSVQDECFRKDYLRKLYYILLTHVLYCIRFKRICACVCRRSESYVTSPAGQVQYVNIFVPWWGSHLFIYRPSVKCFEQALAVKQVSKNIKSFSYLNCLYWPYQLNRNFQSFLGAGFWDASDLSDSEQPLEDDPWAVSAFVLPKKFLKSLCFDILAAVNF